MASIVEQPQWVDPVYLIEPYDPVQGGLTGVSNLQASQLANRTRWLYERFLVEHRIDGTHILKTNSIAKDAGIEESKLDLDYSIADMVAALEELSKARESFEKKLNDLGGGSDSLVNSIYQALIMSWELGEYRMAFDLFNDSFTFRDTFKDQPVLKTVLGDDSVDIQDTSELEVGGKYFIHGTNLFTNAHAYQEVEVKEILDSTRVLFTETMKYSSVDGYLTRAAYIENEDSDGCLLEAGHVYYTRQLDTLKGMGQGELYIKQDTNDIKALQVYTIVDGVKISIDASRITDDGKLVYKMPGKSFKLYIKANRDVNIEYMLLQRGNSHLVQSLVRTPYITSDHKGFYATRYGCYYDLIYKKAEVELKRGTDTFNCFVDNIGWPHSGIEADSYHNPLWCYDFTNSKLYGTSLPTWMFTSPPAPNDPIIWRVRHQNNEDTWSEWSDYGMTTSL